MLSLWKCVLFPCGWACCLTFTFTFSLPVLSAVSLRNRWCTYINCVNYLSTSSVVTLLQSLISVLYCPVAPLFWSSLRFSPTGPVVSMLFAALDHWCASWNQTKKINLPQHTVPELAWRNWGKSTKAYKPNRERSWYKSENPYPWGPWHVAGG